MFRRIARIYGCIHEGTHDRDENSQGGELRRHDPDTGNAGILDAKEGDTLFVVRGDDGSLKVLAHDPTLADALAAAEVVMDENRDLLQALA